MEEFNYDKDKGADLFQFANSSNQSEHVANSKLASAAAAGERSHLLIAEPTAFR
jgi:hypothetical protein